MERTFVMVKPDAVKRGIVGEFVSRFERVGLKITRMQMKWLTKEQAAALYPSDEAWLRMLTKKVKQSFSDAGEEFKADDLEHGKVVKGWLIDYVTSGPVVGMVLEGPSAVKFARKLVGPTDIAVAQPGTIRGDFSIDSLYITNIEKKANKTLIHASGEVSEVDKEIELFFGEKRGRK